MPSNTRQHTARQVSKQPARIRIPNSMVEKILHTPPEKPSMDLLQAQLLRLQEGAVSQDDRILVTRNEDALDLLRDWCTRLIADYRLSDDPEAKQIVASASKVIGFMDNHVTKAERAAQHIRPGTGGRRNGAKKAVAKKGPAQLPAAHN